MKKTLLSIVLASLLLTACGTSNAKKESETGVASTETTVNSTTEVTTTTEETTTTEAATTSGISINDIFEATKAAVNDYLKNSNCYPIDTSDYRDTFINNLKGYSFQTEKCLINYWIIEFDTSDPNCPKINVGDKFALTNSKGNKDDGYTVTAINGNCILALNEVDNKTYAVNWGSSYSDPTAQAIYDAFVSLKK